jgi:biotin operon repressor
MTPEEIEGNLPQALKDLRAWVCWRWEIVKGRRTKVPYNPVTGKRASTTDPSTWTHFATALTAVAAYDGLGIVLTGKLCGVDLDKCRDPEAGDVQEWALDIVSALNSYTEVSPSGTGLHVLQFAALPPGGRKKSYVEMYDSAKGRFFCVTGQHFPGTPLTVEQRQTEIDELHAQIFGAKPHASAQTPAPAPPQPLALSDQELLEVAFAAKNGAEIQHLFGEPGGAQNSEGDASLCGLLAWYSGGDAARLERFMRASHRVRDKWDERRREETWIGRECRLAVEHRMCTGFYDPRTARTEGTGAPPVREPKALLKRGLHDGTLRYAAYRIAFAQEGRQDTSDQAMGEVLRVDRATIWRWRKALAKSGVTEDYLEQRPRPPYFIAPRGAFFDTNLSCGAWARALYLAPLMDGGVACVSEKKLALACGLSERQVRRHLRELKVAGYLAIDPGTYDPATRSQTHPRGRRDHCNRYRFTRLAWCCTNGLYSE